MTHEKRDQMLHRSKRKRRMERPVLFVTTFEKYDPPLSKIFRTRWRNIYDEHKFYNLLPNAPSTAYKNKTSLGSFLSSKRRKFDTLCYIPDLQLGTSNEFKFMQFNHHHHPTRR